MDMVCNCGGKEFFTEKHGNQTGLYCSACGKWQKWLKKDEIRLFDHGVHDGWISVMDRLPDTDRNVIVYDYVVGVVIGYYGKRFNYKEPCRWYLNGVVVNSYEPKITHWRELPDPPRMEKSK